MRATNSRERKSRRFLWGGLLFGVGIGAFVDGIVLHQILQWHHMLTATGDHPATTVVGLGANTLADGLFHVAAFLFTVIGVFILTSDGTDWPGRGRRVTALSGLVLLGWSIFNLVEGVVDHHILTVHHVRDDVADPLPWDVGFLAVSAVIGLVGLVITRNALRQHRM